MRVWSSMPTSEFVFQLREIAIKANARPLVIDAIDQIWFAPSQDEIDEQINEAVEEAEKRAYEDGKEDGELNLKKAEDAAAESMYKDCIGAIEAKGKEIGLTDEQVYKVINHILWDCRP
jgi:flagellar biosynthesis/type III secretory pathway protein FliH